MGVAVSKVAMLTHCQALTQACNYCEGEELHYIREAYSIVRVSLWHLYEDDTQGTSV